MRHIFIWPFNSTTQKKMLNWNQLSWYELKWETERNVSMQHNRLLLPHIIWLPTRSILFISQLVYVSAAVLISFARHFNQHWGADVGRNWCWQKYRWLVLKYLPLVWSYLLCGPFFPLQWQWQMMISVFFHQVIIIVADFFCPSTCWWKLRTDHALLLWRFLIYFFSSFYCHQPSLSSS